MSKISVSKKQIEYCEAIIYILAIIVVIFSNVYGNIYIKMIPLLIILGIVGNILFKRSVTTTVFSMLVAMCIVHVRTHSGILENLMISALLALDVAMGEFLGEYIKKSYKHLKSKEKSSKTSLITYLYTVIILLLALSINTFINGNVINLRICKNSLNNYLKENYSNYKDYEITDIKYTFGIDRKYTFMVENLKRNEQKKYTIFLKNKDVVVDEYKSQTLAENNNKLTEQLKEFINTLNTKDIYSNLNLSAEYIDDVTFKIVIKEEVNKITDIEKEEFAKEIVNFLEDIKKFSKYDNLETLSITIDNINDNQDIISSDIFIEGYENNIKNSKEEPYKYILKSLMIEYISY